MNFDDPGSYHLYYGDELGRPGTCLTFFAWPGATRGRVGPPQVSVTAFSVPLGSMDFWAQRLREQGVEAKAAPERFGEPVLKIEDPDGMHLELSRLGESDRPAMGRRPGCRRAGHPRVSQRHDFRRGLRADGQAADRRDGIHHCGE